MTSRTWQMLFAAASFGLMVVVLVQYGLRDDPPPQSADPEPRAVAERGTAEPRHEGGKPSPIQVYANAKVGDWQAYSVTTESSIGPTFHAIGIVTITEVGEHSVERAFVGRVEETGELRRQAYEARPRWGLTIDQLTTNDVGGWTIHDLAITDEAHELGGRRFACKKLSYASDDPMIAGKRTHTDLWISSDVPVDGLVEEREVQQMPTMRFVITKRLVGFGDASGTTWGARPEGL